MEHIISYYVIIIFNHIIYRIAYDVLHPQIKETGDFWRTLKLD